MKCTAAQERIVLMTYDEELLESEAAELELHLRSCMECLKEFEAMQRMQEILMSEDVVEPSPNLLAESRLKLDAKLDEIGAGSWLDRTRALLSGSWGWVKAAPALTTLLLGVGFLGGNFLNRYQVAHQPIAR